MNRSSYEQIIIAGVRNLSPERQREAAEFVYFLRRREAGEDAEYEHLIETGLDALEANKFKRLEKEFKDYEVVS
jgi:hypothetical protein